MTVTALLLKRRFFDQEISERLKYALLGVLFVNISVGGTLTPFAAPPVLMVSGKWGWDLSFMLSQFGWRAALIVLVNALAVTILFSKELSRLQPKRVDQENKIPFWIIAVHVFFLASIVRLSHHPVVFLGVFLFFLGIVTITMEYQEELKIREGLLVGFFLGGLVVLGGFQRWWLEPLLRSLNPTTMYFGASALTAVLDNAALTYLGSQVPNIDGVMKYALVAGSVTGGGLTVIANAPNPAGFSILKDSFGQEGISPLKLLGYAFVPTVVAVVLFWFIS
jgi:Na+/H+ antiporter NhaD/arsenite permease-like protein